MRHLILTRGAQGAGKSTFIARQGLEPYVLSPDAIRIQMGGVTMGADGRIGINPNNDRKVWEEVERLLEQKMARGEFIVFDATFQSARDFKMPTALAARYGYRVACLDFTGVPVEVAKARNLQRPAWKQVPEAAIDRAYERFATSPWPKGLKILQPEAFEDVSLTAALAEPVRDLNAYAKVHHIGDLQGCHAPLAEYLADGFRDDEFTSSSATSWIAASRTARSSASWSTKCWAATTWPWSTATTNTTSSASPITSRQCRRSSN